MRKFANIGETVVKHDGLGSLEVAIPVPDSVMTTAEMEALAAEEEILDGEVMGPEEDFEDGPVVTVGDLIVMLMGGKCAC